MPDMPELPAPASDEPPFPGVLPLPRTPPPDGPPSAEVQERDSPTVRAAASPSPGSPAVVWVTRPRPGRIVGVDAARGAALLGMAATHVLPDFDSHGHLTWAFRIAAGRSAAAFAVLAGVALALVAARTPRPHLATLMRALCIGLVGLVLGETRTPLAVILVYYAVFFLLVLPLLRAPRWVLAAVAAVTLAGEPWLSQLVRPHLPAPITANPSFSTLVTTPGRLTLTLLLTGYYPALAWVGYLAVGMLVGRLDLRSARTAGWLLAGGAATAVAAKILSWFLLGPLGGRSAILATNAVLPGIGPMPPAQTARLLAAGLYGSTPTQSWWWLAVSSPHATTPLDLVHTTGTAIALLGLALLVARLGADGRLGRILLWPLAAVGSMTLTWYTLHAALLATDALPADPNRSYVLQVVVALVLASAWRATRRRGPLEAAVAAAARAATRRGAVATE
ncbi:DUF1624 domain-containing protein [Frankia sp. AgB1.9]|uniref:heparan-alpha-glucosaminide N-acetyltransferase domain-containing protein n=1 Tax=unclassified Frankia TaxID=2632575 RepID=UPI00193280D2|nr:MULTISPECIES: heparan-alpha-glucosaminide N-acetyltransferase domain-containing protein [unclassified Frankia]MBL7488731.1 DUF1624 domain-containing protein [Frankia sp. AgW1.1]MBL7549657.1 DUF1624 domain-containing protein [Frankia sp. AgB1.9]